MSIFGMSCSAGARGLLAPNRQLPKSVCPNPGGASGHESRIADLAFLIAFWEPNHTTKRWNLVIFCRDSKSLAADGQDYFAHVGKLESEATERFAWTRFNSIGHNATARRNGKPMASVVGWLDIVAAETRIRPFLSPSPLIRSYWLEKALGLPSHRRVWLKDYGWTPVGSFKVMGALHWTAQHRDELTTRPITAHSSGNFASGLAFAAQQFGVRAIIVMPENAPKVKFELTRGFGAEVRTYNIATDHLTGERDRMAREISERENALQASPYDDNDVIAGNGVGGLEIARSLQEQGRRPSHFVCAVSGGGLMAGHALAIKHEFPDARVIGVEPEGANDFQQSLKAGCRVRVAAPASICDGLLSYDVGVHNWPLLQQYVDVSVTQTDIQIKNAMLWLMRHHGLRSEPSGAITTAVLLDSSIDWSGDGDIVVVLSGRNVDPETFQRYCSEVEES